MPTCSCFVPGCKNTSRRKKPNQTFHSFPVQSKTQWLTAIGRKPNVLIIHERICSFHFHANDYEHIGSRKRLRANVIPTLKLPILYQSPHQLPTASTKTLLDKNLIKVTTSTRRSPKMEFGDTMTASDVITTPPKEEIKYSVNNDSASNTLVKEIRLDHSYTRGPDHYQKQLQIERRRALMYKIKWNSANQTSVRRQKKILTLRAVIKDLKTRFKMLTDTVFDSTLGGFPNAE